MSATLNALGLLVVIAVAVEIVRRYGRQSADNRTGFRQVISALIGGFVLFCIVSMLNTHMCWSGEPLTQQLIPSIGLAVVLSLVRTPAQVRRFSKVVFSVAAIILAFQFTVLVHAEHYTGNPEGVQRSTRSMQSSHLRGLTKYLRTHQQPDTSLPAGFLVDSPIVNAMPDSEKREFVRYYLTADKKTVYPFWHTGLTRIYGVKSTPLEAYYPGGRLADAVERVEYRQRPATGDASE